MKKLFENNSYILIKSNLVLMSGLALLVFSLFNFKSDRHCGKDGGLPSLLPECNNPSTYYYYDSLTLILLIVGTILLTLGLLKLKK